MNNFLEYLAHPALITFKCYFQGFVIYFPPYFQSNFFSETRSKNILPSRHLKFFYAWTFINASVVIQLKYESELSLL